MTPGAQNWPTFVSGGKASRFHRPLEAVLKWGNSGHELKAWAEKSTGDSWSRNIRSPDRYMLPGISWPLRASRLSPFFYPADSIFSLRGYSVTAPTPRLPAILGVMSSSVFDYIFKMCVGRAGHPEFVVGVLKQLPLPQCLPAELSALAMTAWRCKRSLATRSETCPEFHLPSLLQVEGATIADRAWAWLAHVDSAEAELRDLQAEIDRICLGLYGLAEDDHLTIGQGANDSDAVRSDDSVNEPDEGEETVDDSELDAAPMVASLIAWVCGVAFGRFDVRIAMGRTRSLLTPDPADPFAACSTGMLVGEDSLPVTSPPPGYPLAFPGDGILVDDPGVEIDLCTCMRQVVGAVLGDTSDERLHEAMKLLDPTRDLRSWMRSRFFDAHIRRYSTTGRRAPIYWQIGTVSASYSVWIYIHRMGPDTLHAVLRDHVEPKLRFEENRLATLSAEAADPTPTQRKGLEAQETFVDELRSFRDELQRVAPLWNPDLDDGVVINASFLHRLFAHTRSWANECEAHWKQLQAGDYNWAHLAMRLWPERVVPKCKEDRSLAIAHGLEDLLWIEDTAGWRLREVPNAEAERVLRRWTDEHCQGLLDALCAWCEAHGGQLQWSRWAAGELDEDPLAVRLFPARVFERANFDADFAARHDLSNLYGRSLDDRTGGRRSLTWRAVLESRHPYRTRTLTEALDEAAAALGPERAGQLLRALSDAELDALPLGRIAAPERVLARCRTDVDFAVRHEVQPIFWLTEDGRWRLRRDPAVEESDAIAARTSSAVKDALNQVASAQASEKVSRGEIRAAPPKPARAATTRTKTKQMPLDLAGPGPELDARAVNALRAALHQFSEGASKSELLAVSGLDESQWKSALDTLTASGEVDRTGQKRSTRYTLRRAGGSS